VFQQMLGGVHALPVEISVLMRRWSAPRVLRAYLAEVQRMVASPVPFTVLAHVDYPVRYWPAQVDPYNPTEFETEFRAVLAAAVGGGRVLEVNTRLPVCPLLLGWWREAGGMAVTVGSDAHTPVEVGRGFAAAAGVLREHGFAPPTGSGGPWCRDT
jgi:histidinol-phosphatase (PHP family)